MHMADIIFPQANRFLQINDDCKVLIMKAFLLSDEATSTKIEQHSTTSTLVSRSRANFFSQAFPELSQELIDAADNASRIYELHFETNAIDTAAAWAMFVSLDKIKYLRLMIGDLATLIDSMPNIEALVNVDSTRSLFSNTKHQPTYQIAKLLECLPNLIDLEIHTMVGHYEIEGAACGSTPMLSLRSLLFHTLPTSLKHLPKLCVIKVQNGNPDRWPNRSRYIASFYRWSARRVRTARGWRMDMEELTVTGP